MPKSLNQKAKLLMLERLFAEDTDEENQLTLDEITRRLSSAGISAERKALYSDIETLREMGVDIIAQKAGRTTTYYQSSRAFEQPELQLLANAVACSKFITDRKSRMLIGKIAALASPSGKKTLNRQIIVSDRIKTMNEQIYYNIDRIGEAISANKKISFLYFNYDRSKKAVYHNNRQPMTVSPYSLTWKDENYYCVCYNEKHSAISSLRVDRMERVELLDDRRFQMPDFNAAEYSKTVFGMFGGEDERVTMRFDDSLAGVVIDRFGAGTNFACDEGSFSVSVRLRVSPNFFGWLCQFGDKAEIVGPRRVREAFEAHISAMMKSYGE